MKIMRESPEIQPLGEEVPNWIPPDAPSVAPMVGRYCRLEKLNAEAHSQELYESNRQDAENRIWTYLPYGPFESYEAYQGWVEQVSRSLDPLFFAIIDSTNGQAVGVASYLRIDRPNGVIEVGHLNYSPRLQRTRAATEAMALMMARVFESGYRRYEWKCNALNVPSRTAAERYGFSFEGVFRQAGVVKGRNRDTSWYAAIDREWPALRTAFEAWLSPENFDTDGRQIVSLRNLTKPILESAGKVVK
jgi:RimJ/RimL family protein N-acetyltransferase